MWRAVRSGVLAFLLLAACGQNCPPPPEKEVIPPLTPITEGEPNLNGYRLVTPESATVSEMWTNLEYGGRPQKEAIRVPVPTPIYDVAYVVYSQSFADRYGYPGSHVSELSDGLHLMEFRMKNVGAYGYCWLNVLIDKGQGHFLEGQPFYYKFFGFGSKTDFHLPIHLPKRREGFSDRREDMEFRAKHRTYDTETGVNMSRNKSFLAARNYEDDKWGSVLSSTVEAYHAFMFAEYDYFSIRVGCTELPARIFLADDSMLWIQKKGSKGDPVVSQKGREDVLRFKIPYKLKEQARPFLESFSLTYQIWKKASEEAFGIVY